VVGGEVATAPALTPVSEPIAPDGTAVVVRPYDDADYVTARTLWAELTERHRELYGDATIGGDDPGGGLDGYLADPDRLGSWVAEDAAGVIGLTGLLGRGESGEVEPVVVTAQRRGDGVGRRLIEHVIEEARARGFAYVSIRPVARNVEAIRSFHALGFTTLGGHVDLTMDLAERRHAWHEGVELHGREFRF
jgi:GNAT superfamily N-acetyltransferase